MSFFGIFVEIFGDFYSSAQEFFLVERKYFPGVKNIFAYSLGDILSSRSIKQSAYFTKTTKFTNNSPPRLLIVEGSHQYD